MPVFSAEPGAQEELKVGPVTEAELNDSKSGANPKLNQTKTLKKGKGKTKRKAT